MAERDKGTEDIVGRLEALRKRVPEEKGIKPTEEIGGPPDSRKKIYRYVGIAIVVLIIIGMMFLTYRYVYAPAREASEVEEGLKIQEQSAFIQAKSQKKAEIQDAYAGLPPEYMTDESLLLEQVSAATSTREIDAVDISGPATSSWRAYLQERLDEIAMTSTYKLEMRTEAETYKGYDEIKMRINRLSHQELKNAVIQELQTEFIPIRLPRLQAGGVPDVGNVVNVYYKTVSDKKTGSNITLLAKDARIVAVIRAKSSGSNVALSESESRQDTGGGAEMYGTLSGLKPGSIGSLTGSGEGSAGFKIRGTTTTYSVKIEELQKAAAASKLPESYITEVLEDYGIKLNTIEREANIGDLDTEYLMLLEVSEDEALTVVQKIADENERVGKKDRTKMNIFITISKPPSWASK